jgi:hypothetical protein
MSFQGYQAYLNQNQADWDGIYISLTDGVLHVESNQIISKPVENSDILPNTIQLDKLNSSIYSIPANVSTLVFRDNTGAIFATSLTGVIQTGSQPNITSLGTLTNLNVAGNISVGGTVNNVDISAFKADYDSKIDQDVKTNSSPTFAGLTLTGTVNVRDVIPIANNMYNLGSPSFSFANGYIHNLVTNSITTNQYVAGDGSASAPSYSFQSNPGLGLYRSNTNELSIATDGIQRLNISDNGLKMFSNISADLHYTYNIGSSTRAFLGVYSQKLYAAGGTSSFPSISFFQDTNTGMYRPSVDTIHMTCGGLNRFRLNNNTFEIDVENRFVNTNPQLTNTYDLGNSSTVWRTLYLNNSLLGNGSAGSPSYSFQNDTDSGIYSSGANELSFATNGTQRFIINSNDQILGQAGSYTNPTYSFIGQTNSGFCRGLSANQVAICTSGLSRLLVDTNYVSASVVYRTINGSETTPSYAFNVDNYTGMYLNSINNLAFSVSQARRLSISTSRATFELPVTINNQASKTEIRSNTLGMGRLIINEPISGATNPGLEIWSGASSEMKGGMFYNQPTNTVEIWHRTARWAWYDIVTDYSSLRGKRVGLDLTGSHYLNNSIDFSVNGTRFAHFVVSGSPTEYGALALGYANGEPIYHSNYKIYLAQGRGIWFDGDSGGSASMPLIRIASSDSGIYAVSDDQIGVSCAAQLRLIFNTAGLRVESSTGRILNQSGSNASPSYSFTSDDDTGMLSAGADQLGFTTGGTRRLTINNTRAYFADLISVGVDNDNFIGSNADGQMRFGTDNAERMRLVNQGLLINRTSHTTSNCKLDIDGDTRFANTFCEIRYITKSTTCSIIDNWYKVDVTGFDAGGSLTTSLANNNVTITTRGRFRVEFSVSLYATVGYITRVCIFENGNSVTKTIREVFHASTAGSSAPRSLAGSYIADVVTDTTFDLRVQCSNGIPQDIVINYGTVIIHRV